MVKQSSHSSARSWRGVLLALVIGMMATAVLATAGCSAAPQSTTPAETAPAQEATAPAAAAPTTATEAPATVTKLKITDTKVGKGAKVKNGDTVSVYYTGWLLDGTKFDSNAGTGKTFDFAVGTGYVIPGWDQGLVGMKVGGKRTLIIPSELGYGAQGSGPIPGNAPLKFEVELVKVTPAK